MTGTHRRSPKDPNLQLLSDLLTRCRKLVTKVYALRKRCAELASEAATGTATTLRAFPADIAACDQRVLECIAADATQARRAEIIQSVPGCGPVMVAVMRKLACPLTALLREDRCWQAEPPVRALQAVE